MEFTAMSFPALTGFSPGLPPLSPPAWAEIDAQMCAEMRCPCGRTGLTYKPMRRGMRLKGVASCVCGFAEEV
jgi:hypothetical protein